MTASCKWWYVFSPFCCRFSVVLLCFSKNSPRYSYDDDFFFPSVFVSRYIHCHSLSRKLTCQRRVDNETTKMHTTIAYFSRTYEICHDKSIDIFPAEFYRQKILMEIFWNYKIVRSYVLGSPNSFILSEYWMNWRIFLTVQVVKVPNFLCNPHKVGMWASDIYSVICLHCICLHLWYLCTTFINSTVSIYHLIISVYNEFTSLSVMKRYVFVENLYHLLFEQKNVSILCKTFSFCLIYYYVCSLKALIWHYIQNFA